MPECVSVFVCVSARHPLTGIKFTRNSMPSTFLYCIAALLSVFSIEQNNNQQKCFPPLDARFV